MLPIRRLVARNTGLLVNPAVRKCFHSLPVIQVGDSLPQIDLYENFPTDSVRLPDALIGKNVVLFGVPGAFTPGCSNTHLPGYIEASYEMKKEGVHEIICVSVNDAYVMSAWGAMHKAKGKVRMLADPSGAFVYSLGLGMNYMPLGGFRAQRFSMFITDNKIKEINIEPDGTGLSCTLAKHLVYKKHLRNTGELN